MYPSEGFFISYYDTDASALLENWPLVKLIQNYTQDPGDIFSIYSVIRISMMSHLLTCFCLSIVQ